jgi:hypothetical protein
MSDPLELHSEPSDSLLVSLSNPSDDGPIVALNLNRYRKRALYPAGTPDGDVSGRSAYARYGMVAVPAILSVGGRVLWAANAEEVAIGCEHDRYDEVVAVWYPSRRAFLGLTEYPGYLEALELDRRAAVEHATLLFFRAGTEPKLDASFGS